MKRLREAIGKMFFRLSCAVKRFPLTVFCLVCSTILTCYMISLHEPPELIIEKLMYTFVLGAFLGVAAQFACERFPSLLAKRLAVYALSVLLTGGYYLIIAPVADIDYAVRARTFVAVFSMFCAYVWLPAYREKADFNKVALIHFKSAAISVLYAGVLAVGLSSIIGAVDILLFKVNSDAYGYMMAIVWILFATVYYLSLLPRFNSELGTDLDCTEEAGHFPRFLEILVSYIAVPLVAAFTVVLLAYFVKIGVTRVWPTGHLGPMILGYSSAGLIIYILASSLENRFAVFYQRVFPKVLIPVVIMQLVSVYIRLNAYGFTESRYYVALFGVFSIAAGVVLSLKPVKKNSLIALLAAAFAIFSIIPPLDAFTVSRNSQVTRLETMLQSAEILVDGEIRPKADADLNLRLETTSILNYLERRNHLEEVAWIPEDFDPYSDMEKVFGFEPAYGDKGQDNYFFAMLDMQKPLDISGYDVMLQADSYRHLDVKEKMETSTYDFEVKGSKYKLVIERQSSQEARVSVRNEAGDELVATGLYDFATTVTGVSSHPKEALDAEELTLDVEGDSGSKLRIIFQHINITYGSGADAGADYNMFVLFAPPGEG